MNIRRPERWIGRGALLGFAVGLCVGLIAGHSVAQTPSGSPIVDAEAAGVEVLAGMVIGTGLGAVAGAVIKIDRTVYLARESASAEPEPRP